MRNERNARKNLNLTLENNPGPLLSLFCIFPTLPLVEVPKDLCFPSPDLKNILLLCSISVSCVIKQLWVFLKIYLVSFGKILLYIIVFINILILLYLDIYKFSCRLNSCVSLCVPIIFLNSKGRKVNLMHKVLICIALIDLDIYFSIF